MAEIFPTHLTKICGTCAKRKSPVCLNLKFVRACAGVVRNPDEVNAATLATLIKEAETLSRRKYKCSKEPNAWTHLMDRACAFWQPAEENLISENR